MNEANLLWAKSEFKNAHEQGSSNDICMHTENSLSSHPIQIK